MRVSRLCALLGKRVVRDERHEMSRGVDRTLAICERLLYLLFIEYCLQRRKNSSS